ncbi:uncharacterized protein LOC115925946 [Strongylocentrotus purpuratus]|uniref:C3H1-type domain-containing protein n=1 Tax=Strongylocentrotus purpuratus TaxID=7668 RepID=A0A7M7P3T1_STRPU|nr:uncharacterized protein LOC115925946 [Strongylocentrotus purpuratus]
MPKSTKKTNQRVTSKAATKTTAKAKPRKRRASKATSPAQFPLPAASASNDDALPVVPARIQEPTINEEPGVQDGGVNGESWPEMAIDDFDTNPSMFTNEALVSPAPVTSTGVPTAFTPGTGFPVPGQPQMLAGVGDDLGSSIAVTLKEKIWRGEFIDLGALLSPSMSDPSVDEGLTLIFSPASANFQLRAPNRKTAITGIPQWTSAMLVFVSVYAERHTRRVRELLKYISIVRTAASCGYNWCDYDLQFRLRQARQPERSWAVVDAELWLLVATAYARPDTRENFRPSSGRQSQFRGAQRPRQQLSGPRRNGRSALNRVGYGSATASPRAQVCFAFNASGRCGRGRGCRYAHKCDRCGNTSHGSFACNRPQLAATKPSPSPNPN